jgi:hypothetical protein
MRRVPSFLIYNSVYSITVKLYSDHQRRLEAHACGIVEEREKRKLQLRKLRKPRLRRLARHVSCR